MSKLKGIYLVIDPKREWSTLLEKLKSALGGGLNIVQVWNHWGKTITHQDKKDFLEQVKTLCEDFDVPVLMHEDWKLALTTALDGVHFDTIPEDFDHIKEELHSKIMGVTVSNDLEKIKWADRQNLSYISFCSIFPSSSVDTCDIVRPENIQSAKKITDMSIFLSGGIKPENISQLSTLNYDGVAIISGILDEDNPSEAVKKYRQIIQQKV